jgi:hypothetical protein
MTNNAKELLDIINDTQCPEKSVAIAFKIILDFLEQRESFQERAAVVPRESA